MEGKFAAADLSSAGAERIRIFDWKIEFAPEPKVGAYTTLEAWGVH